MNTENVAKWVQALRSGEYEQTQEVLAREPLAGESSFCCLGVACEVAIQDGLDIERKVNVEGNVLYDTSVATLPDSVSRWLGVGLGYENVSVYTFNTNNDVVDSHLGERVTVTLLNDRFGFSFEEIADALEKEYL